MCVRVVAGSPRERNPRSALKRFVRIVAIAALAAVVWVEATPAVCQDEVVIVAERWTPALRLSLEGPSRNWTVGEPVIVRWRQRRLRGASVRVVVSRDRGRTWRVIGRALAEHGRLSWVVDGQWGIGLVRVETADGRRRSATRRVRFVAPVREIGFGASFCVALHEDGKLRMWGQIDQAFSDPLIPGLPNLLRRPTVVDVFDDVTSLSVGPKAVMVARGDGSAWFWGPFSVSRTARRVEGVENAIWVRTAPRGSFIRVADGRVFAFGSNPWGLFEGGAGSEYRAEEVPELFNVVDISLGDDHGLALRDDGVVLSFGSNFLGQLGDSTEGARLRPADVPGVRGVVAIDAAVDTSIALRDDGTVLIWGMSQSLVSDGERGWTSTPTVVPGLDRVVAIVNGGSTGNAVRSDGALFAWGANFGYGLSDDSEILYAPTLIDRAPQVERMWAGTGSIHVIDPSGRRFAWGPNGSYTVGDGTDQYRRFPVRIHSR